MTSIEQLFPVADTSSFTQLNSVKGLPDSVSSILKDLGITTVGALAVFSEKELLAISGFDPPTIEQIKAALEMPFKREISELSTSSGELDYATLHHYSKKHLILVVTNEQISGVPLTFLADTYVELRVALELAKAGIDTPRQLRVLCENDVMEGLVLAVERLTQMRHWNRARDMEAPIHSMLARAGLDWPDPRPHAL